MESTFEILEAQGILSDRQIHKIDRLTDSAAIKLYEQVFEALLEAQKEWFESELSDYDEGPLDPFTFVAGASLRGDSGCGAHECRIQKLDFLGRYAALYASRVTVPLPIRPPDLVHNARAKKYLLTQTAMTLLRLRPLIKRNIIRPSLMATPHCVHTRAWMKKLINFVHQLADESAANSLAEFTAVYQLP